jgi:hypothetical protein
MHADNPPRFGRRPEQAQLKTVKYPNGSFMGLEERRAIAASGRGMQWSEKGVPQGLQVISSPGQTSRQLDRASGVGKSAATRSAKYVSKIHNAGGTTVLAQPGLYGR